MTQRNPLSAFPERVCLNAKTGALGYVRQPGLYAVHGSPSVPPGPEIERLDEGIVIRRGDPNDEARKQSNETLGAVYALEGGGPPAVPTGRIFVRMREGSRVDERRADIESAGYVIESIPEYAPHAAWLRHRSGDIAQSLHHLDALDKLSDVESIEPQMLMASARR